MNTDKLREIVDRVFDAESELKTQEQLDNLRNCLANLAGNPQEGVYQTEMAVARQRFAESMAEFRNVFSPRDYARVLQLSDDTFSQGTVEKIKQSIQENAMSPNVANELAQEIYNRRGEVFAKLADLRNALEYFGFGYVEAEHGHAEVGFEIPRKLFADNLDGLIKELGEIRRIIQFFSEVSQGKYTSARVSSISTTDPLFFFVMAVVAAKCVAGSVEWAISVWRSVEEIRHLRMQAEQNNAFTREEIEEFFDKKIVKLIDSEVEKKVEELIRESPVPESRKGEMSGQMDWALNTLLAKLERGMTIELRIPPPPISEDEEADKGAGDDSERRELLNIQRKLSFPDASENPILRIRGYDENSGRGVGERGIDR